MTKPKSKPAPTTTSVEELPQGTSFVLKLVVAAAGMLLLASPTYWLKGEQLALRTEIERTHAEAVKVLRNDLEALKMATQLQRADIELNIVKSSNTFMAQQNTQLEGLRKDVNTGISDIRERLVRLEAAGEKRNR